MDALQSTLSAHAAGSLALGGALIGLVFGWVVYQSNFCVMGSLSDIVNLGDWRRLRAWILAALVALVATQTLHAIGVVPLERAMYLTPRLNWFGNVAGGLIFGFGMVLAGGCPTRNLVRFGGGDLRALVVLLALAITGMATLGGIIGPLRDGIEQLTAIDLRRFGLATQGVGEMVAKSNLAATAVMSLVLTVALATAGLVFVFCDAGFRGSSRHVASGVAVGLLVAAGWALTGLVYDEMAVAPVAPISLTFIRPMGDTLDWLQRFTATPWPGFGVATVIGTGAGALLAALRLKRFRVLGFANVADLKANLIGASMMGLGGAMATGCTIGHGVTGVSTLAFGSFLSVAALIEGGRRGLHYLERTV